MIEPNWETLLDKTQLRDFQVGKNVNSHIFQVPEFLIMGSFMAVVMTKLLVRMKMMLMMMTIGEFGKKRTRHHSLARKGLGRATGCEATSLATPTCPP